MPLKLGIPRETANGERRVSMDPAVLSQLTKLGIKVFIQKGAGDSAFFDDASYKEAIIVEGELPEPCQDFLSINSLTSRPFHASPRLTARSCT